MSAGARSWTCCKEYFVAPIVIPAGLLSAGALWVLFRAVFL